MKETIVQVAESLGFQRTVIAGLEPLGSARRHYEQWLSQDHAAGMEYLKRNVELRTSPQLLFPHSVSAIIVSASYYTTPPPHPGPGFGRVANYAVGLDYHAVLRARLRELKARLEKIAGRLLLGKAYTDDVALYEQAFAARYGIGFPGKNTLIIGPKTMGSYHFLAELMTDLPLEPDEPYNGTCGNCFRCGSACPTDAIVQERNVDARKCISYLTIENKGGIPLELRAQLGDWVFGCDICQEVCPYNRKPPLTPWIEFHPESGVGHHLDLVNVLRITSEEEFRSRFFPTPLRRPKLRGLSRNALVVLGNQKPEHALNTIVEFLSRQPDPMLREHAGWALSRYEGIKSAKRALERAIRDEPDDECRLALQKHLQ